MFAVNVQSVSVQQLNAYGISQFTQTSNSFAVVNVVNSSNVNVMLCHISRDVLNNCHLNSINVHAKSIQLTTLSISTFTVVVVKQGEYATELLFV